MVDNSWIHEKRPSGRSGWQSKMMKTKVFMTVAVILAGTILAVSLNGLGSNATLYQSEGVVVDFGGYKTSWTDVDYKETDDPVEWVRQEVKGKEVEISTETNSQGELTVFVESAGLPQKFFFTEL